MKKLMILLILCVTTIALAQDGAAPSPDGTGVRINSRGGIAAPGAAATDGTGARRGRGGAGGAGGGVFGGGRRGQPQVYKYQGLALTPPMGWNTWNTFGTNINETLIKETATIIANKGLKDAGYVYVVLDDAWMARERDENGQLVADPVKFPSGMKALGDFLHSLGLKFGIYNDAGTRTCAGYPGGRGHEYEDARLYASWGVDYVKYDWCNTGSANAQETYRTFGLALLAAKRPMILSMCEWGTAKPWEWASPIAHLWRTTGDIQDRYSTNTRGRGGYGNGWKDILDRQTEQKLEQYAGPDHWNDPDMMEVGNRGLTFAESRAHFSFWCMLAAPLMMGNDLRIMTDDILKVLTDKDVIALDQDPLGKQGYRLIDEEGREVWVKELSNGNWAVCMLNDSPADVVMTLAWSDIPVLAGKTYKVRDLWSKKDLGTTKDNYSGSVVTHDVALFRLTPAE
ncbi:MAG: glycoside hydrolase family 27 protein [Sedimentisphaerales bacterium]|nr:glycoside hydrolase family 27 protein [Sedimentisphaerales bacterium]